MSSFTRQELESFIKGVQKSMRVMFTMPILKIQRQTTTDRGVRGPQWVSKAVLPAPAEEDVRGVLLDAIKALGDGQEQYDVPSIAPVPVQWVGNRSGVSKTAPEPPELSEQAKYDALVSECTSDITLMYTYGGAHYMNGPAIRRGVALALSKMTGARSVIIQHRLAPQCPFPSQLLDVLVAYLSLLYPPPGSFHAPVDPKKLVLVGDSTGCQLALGIVQMILAAQRGKRDVPMIRFHGRSVPLVLPAGVALQSPAVGGCLPSWERNATKDILPVDVPQQKPDFPQDAAWPTNPPREDPYCELPCYMNPLVNPMCATLWRGAPPLYISVGSEEMQYDPVSVVAQTAARQDVPVIWDEYESMPHNWPMMMPAWPQSTQCMRNWAQACVRFATSGNQVTASGTFMSFDPDASGKRSIRALDPKELTTLTAEDVTKGMSQGIVDTRETARPFMEKARSRL